MLHPRPDEAEYERIAPTYPDTAAGQWELAQWCREHKLTAQRQVHLRRVIELDPNHVEARRALGYSQVDGRWATQEEVMKARGFVRHNGKWLMPQEVELAENKRKLDTAQQEWCQKLKRWRGWLGTDRDSQARDNIAAVNDPDGGKGLGAGIARRPRPAGPVVVRRGPGEDRRARSGPRLGHCVDLRRASRRCGLPASITCRRRSGRRWSSYYVGKLKDKKSTNEIINLAGVGTWPDERPVGHRPADRRPGYDAQVSRSSPPAATEAMSPTFGNGPERRRHRPGDGRRTKVHPPYIANQSVLDALVALTGRNFNFDKQAWKYWYAAQKKAPDALDARRDEK